ncbi:MAG: FG-GAP-like repeat-containing protein, partial [Deltaproteobacteria bacterium]|nr:FG-GAP-like repeat-containing protein [Deltaproteobacteria bacterium]
QSPPAKEASLNRKTPYKVVILPVVIHSPENIGFIREGLLDMLSSRIELSDRVQVVEKSTVKKALTQVSGEADAEIARRIGQELKVDFVVFGSVTKLGDSASLDMRVVDVKNDKPAEVAYTQAGKMEEIVARVDELARRIDERILGYSLTPVIAEKKEPAVSPRETPAGPPPLPGFQPMTQTRETRAALEFWRSQSLNFDIKGLAVGDVDGDGQNEFVMIDEHNLYIYRWDKEFKLIKKLEGGSLQRYIAVDTGDISKSGKAQIFITSVEGADFASLAVAYKDGAFQVIAKDLGWFLRVIDWGEKGKVLLGQGKEREGGLNWPVYEIGWNGKTFKDIRKADLPRGVSINGMAPFTYEGKTFFAFLETDSRMKVADSQGRVLWRSRESYGTNNGFRVKPFPVGVGNEQGDDMFFVNSRILSRGSEIFVLKNIGPVGELFKRARVYTRGEVQRMAWTGGMLQETWKSQDISGYMADLQFFSLNPEGEKTLVVATQFSKEFIVAGQASSALMISRLQGAN